jgi:hypothetical protein
LLHLFVYVFSHFYALFLSLSSRDLDCFLVSSKDKESLIKVEDLINRGRPVTGKMLRAFIPAPGQQVFLEVVLPIC